jgi:hypothetical protein
MARCKQSARKSTGGKAPPKQLSTKVEEMPLKLEGSRSLTDITLVLLLSAKSADTKKAQTFLSTR